MEGMPSASVKDLLSTGYFYEELKQYTDSKEIDLSAYSRNFAVPYLTRMVHVYKESGQDDRADIFTLAINSIKEVPDDELIESILGLKKMTSSEIDFNERSLHEINQDDKSVMRACRRKSESAQVLAKLLVSIIKMFKLPESTAGRKARQVTGDAMKENEESAVQAG